MKRQLFLATVAITALASCSNDLLVENVPQVPDGSDLITFDNVLTSNSTRTSKLTGKSFGAGDAMAIYGIQDGNTASLLFNKQLVEYGQPTWSYTPEKYWNLGSTYEFYGLYPYAADHAFDVATRNFSITGFTVADAIADQVDLMIAEKNTTGPRNTVNMLFNHILSNVNFKGKVSENVKGVKEVTIDEFTISGLKNKGDFAQDGFETGTSNVKGAWTGQDGIYPFPETKDIEMTTTLGDVIVDLLMMPQDLDATLSIKYTLSYEDGTSSSYEKEIALQSIKAGDTTIDKWNMNTHYTYTMILDPTTNDITQFPIDWDGSLHYDATPNPDSQLKRYEVDDKVYYTVVAGGEEYALAWEDLDGDGLLEAGVDRDGDGLIDNVDSNNTLRHNPANTENEGEDQVTDGNPENPNGRDVILLDEDGSGFTEIQLEATYTQSTEDPTKCELDWNGSMDADNNASTNRDDEITPVKNSKIVEINNSYFVWYDENGDEVQDADELKEVHWKDIDGDGWEEAFLGDMDGDNADNAPDVLNQNPLKDDPQEKIVTDGDETNNPNHYDVIQLREPDEAGELCTKQWERKLEIVTDDNIIRFSAEVEDWNEYVTPELEITQ